MYLKKEDIFNFNVDEIEIYWTFSNYIELLKWINDSNSDYITFQDFTLKKSDKLRDYTFKIDFWKDNFPCFAFYIWKQINSRITTRDYFKVYWSAFQIMELNEIIDFISTYVDIDYVDWKKWKKVSTLKRFDLAIDLKKNITEDIIPNFWELKQKWTKYFWNSWELETYYIWEYKKRENKSFLIRIYDKIKDIKKKWKQKIYPSYLLEKDITRIEIEFRSEIIKFFNINQLLDKSYIFNLFIKYIEKHTNIFEKMKTQDINKLKRLNKKIDLEDLKNNQVLKDKYIGSFLWYSKTILKIWICPVDILINSLIITENTKSNLYLWMDNNKFDIQKYIYLKNKKKSKNINANAENNNERS